ncbi:2,3-diketo-L-gulonate reductase [Enterobacter cloacae]|uniref:2,3-diketo-L-gulonate reductase n=1 Tax=Enterobacter cloacae TaxID=550 RepID=A0A377LRJ3_ENTCL|nr:2,3-diketo-L-gulonate reductase [Enterobacter cloacae]
MKVTFRRVESSVQSGSARSRCKAETADACAEMFARTTESGVYSHGVNRFRVLFSNWTRATSFLMPSQNG